MKRVIVAIDPGNEQSAYCMWDGERIWGHGKKPNEELLAMLEVTADDAARANYDLQFVIEQIAHYGTGMPAGRTVFDTCFWIGRFAQRLVDIGEPLPRLIERRHVKMHLCGNPRAKDGNIRQALIDRFGPPGTKREPGLTHGLAADTWQVFALAVTALEVPV